MDAIISTGKLSSTLLSGAFPFSSHHQEEEESFAWADDETLESLPSTTKTVDNIEIATEQTIQLLDMYVYRDPLADLRAFYRQEGISNIDYYLKEQSLAGLFRYSFECPLKGTFFHSSLPLLLFGNEAPLDDLLLQLSQKVLGSYEIFEDGVYFSSRKHAKRACVLAVLESLGVVGESTIGGVILYPSPREALRRLGQLSPTSVASPLKTTRSRIRYFPTWVHELCRVGVEAKDLSITYQQQYTTVPWNEQPTLLSCIISIKALVELTAVGWPCETKRAALDSAVSLLVEELERQVPDLPEAESPSTEELKNILDCDPKNAVYVYPLPHWATTPMPLARELCRKKEKRHLYLSELELKSSQGHALFGVVFPCDPEMDALAFETEFSISGSNQQDVVSANLQRCTTLDLDDLTPFEIESRMLFMKYFNQMATQKTKTVDIENPPSDSLIMLERSYFIVPMTRTGFGSARSSEVDWKMLEHLWQQRKNHEEKPSASTHWTEWFLFVVGLSCIAAPFISKEVKQQSGLALLLFLLTLMAYILLVHLPSKGGELSPFHQQMMHYTTVIMPLLEREMEVARFSKQLCCMTTEIRAEKSAGAKDAYECSQTLRAAMKEATTLVPRVTYHRLEILGDSVLGFFLSMNLMGMNCSLEWDSDELARILSASANYRALCDAGLSSGVSRLVFERQLLGCPSDRHCGVVDSLLSIDRIPKAVIEDHVLSDVVASLLGAAYLDGSDSSRGSRMVIALLEHYSLPLPGHNSKSKIPFFQAAGPCIKSGYPFNQDKPWRRQLVQIGTTLYCEHDVINRLEKGCLKLVDQIFSQSAVGKQHMEKQTAKILLLCSLFNDNLSGLLQEESFRHMDSSFASGSISSPTRESDQSSNIDSAFTPESGLLRIALLRDTLFMVGHSGLHLAITNELLRMYPASDDADLSLIRSCATSDDTMAYIMVKNGFQQSLYHHNTRAEKRFVSEIGASEDMGRKVWNRRFGWILKGGKHEYARRCASLSFPMPHGLPRYCGLAGGRLYGHKTKLPVSLTEDLVFSIKSIAGALVLSIGLKGMWQSLGPVFGELLLLGADELRVEYHKTSSIVSRSIKTDDSANND